jgi:hypothetical protein
LAFVKGVSHLVKCLGYKVSCADRNCGTAVPLNKNSHAPSVLSQHLPYTNDFFHFPSAVTHVIEFPVATMSDEDFEAEYSDELLGDFDEDGGDGYNKYLQ